MIFTIEMVHDNLKREGLPGVGTPNERRELLANHIEAKYGDFVEGWEIRTGRSWNTMTSDEASDLMRAHPETVEIPGVISRLLSPPAFSIRVTNGDKDDS